MTINVFSITGNYAVDCDEGQLLYSQISATLDKNELVVVDFTGVDVILSAFLSTCIAQLYTKYSVELIEINLFFVGLAPRHLSLIKEVKDNAQTFQQNNQTKKIEAKDIK